MVYPLSNVDLIPLFRSYFFILHVPTDNPLNPCFCCLRLLMISHLTPKMFFVLKAVGSSSSKQGQRKSFQHLSAFFVVLSQELDFFPLRGDYLPTKTSFSPLRTHTKKSLFFSFLFFFGTEKMTDLFCSRYRLQREVLITQKNVVAVLLLFWCSISNYIQQSCF